MVINNIEYDISDTRQWLRSIGLRDTVWLKLTTSKMVGYRSKLARTSG